MSTFKERFNLLYEESELSQEEFGKKFSITKDQVFNWRNGRGEPDLETVRKIAYECKVSADWLLGNSIVRTPIETIAAHREDDYTKELPPEKQEEVKRFIEFVLAQHRKENNITD